MAIEAYSVGWSWLAVSHVSDNHRKFISVAVEAHSMTTDQPDHVEIEVALPEELLTELDEYRAARGYPTRSAVVAQALKE